MIQIQCACGNVYNGKSDLSRQQHKHCNMKVQCGCEDTFDISKKTECRFHRIGVACHYNNLCNLWPACFPWGAQNCTIHTRRKRLTPGMRRVLIAAKKDFANKLIQKEDLYLGFTRNGRYIDVPILV